jgi:hypothetical protein
VTQFLTLLLIDSLTPSSSIVVATIAIAGRQNARFWM